MLGSQLYCWCEILSTIDCCLGGLSWRVCIDVNKTLALGGGEREEGVLRDHEETLLVLHPELSCYEILTSMLGLVYC